MKHTLALSTLLFCTITITSMDPIKDMDLPAKTARERLVTLIKHPSPSYVSSCDHARILTYEDAITNFQKCVGGLATPDRDGVTVHAIAQQTKNKVAIQALQKALREEMGPARVAAQERLEQFIAKPKNAYFIPFENPTYYHGCKNAFELAIHDFQKHGGRVSDFNTYAADGSLLQQATSKDSLEAVIALSTAFQKEKFDKEKAATQDAIKDAL